MATRIYTKTGDAGETGLFGGQRVRKDDLRVEAYGAVDELNAQLGVAHAHCDIPDLKQLLHTLQSRLFDLGADLATPPTRDKRPVTLDDSAVRDLEKHIDAFEAELPPLKTFILPGGTQLAAALHVARCVCRRAERRTVHLLAHDPAVGTLPVVMLNRLSDLLFVMARLANHRVNTPDVPWHKSHP